MRALASLTLCLAACASGGAGRESNPWEDLGRGKESGPSSIWAGPCGTSSSKADYS